MAEWLLEIADGLVALDGSGVVERNEGGLFVGRCPPRPDGYFSQAYVHSIYSPLTAADFEAVEAIVGQPLFEHLRDFYAVWNGCRLFSGSLSINGLRRVMDRRGAPHLPVSIAYGNTVELPRLAAGDPVPVRDRIRFGFYAHGGGSDLNAARDGRIFLSPAGQLSPVLTEWTSFPEFLTTEVERLAHSYRQLEGKIDPLNPISPPVTSAERDSSH